MTLVDNQYVEIVMGYQEYVVRVYDNGAKNWYQNCKLHRLDGPAVEYANGDKHWYQNGKLHCLDGPAIERANGNKYWYQNGKRHRLDGPAIEYADGDKSWYIDDVKLTEQEHAARTFKSACDKTITIDGVEYVLTLKK